MTKYNSPGEPSGTFGFGGRPTLRLPSLSTSQSSPPLRFVPLLGVLDPGVFLELELAVLDAEAGGVPLGLIFCNAGGRGGSLGLTGARRRGPSKTKSAGPERLTRPVTPKSFSFPPIWQLGKTLGRSEMRVEPLIKGGMGGPLDGKLKKLW